MELLIKNLTKTYSNKVKALDNVSLKIGVGMFGLLGPNGAGKSTLMRTIATIQSPDSGEIHFNNCLLYTSPSPRDSNLSRMPSSA